MQLCNKQFSCGNVTIEITDRYKYLGLWFQEHLDMKYATNELSKSASRALSVLYTKFKNTGGMAYDVYCKLYSSLVEPILFYCSGIWGLTDYGTINTVQNKACRYFLGVGKMQRIWLQGLIWAGLTALSIRELSVAVYLAN